MPPLTDQNSNKYYTTLDEAKVDGFTPVKATSVLSFFRLSNKCRVISKENIVPFTDVTYTVHAKSENRYYVRQYANHDIDTMFFYYQRQGNEMAEVESLFQYISDGNVYILFKAEDLSEIRDMMNRCYKHIFNGEPPSERWGSIFYDIIKEELRYDEYKRIGKNLTGFLTVCNQFDISIRDLWNSVYLKTQSNK